MTNITIKNNKVTELSDENLNQVSGGIKHSDWGIEKRGKRRQYKKEQKKENELKAFMEGMENLLKTYPMTGIIGKGGNID